MSRYLFLVLFAIGVLCVILLSGDPRKNARDGEACELISQRPAIWLSGHCRSLEAERVSIDLARTPSFAELERFESLKHVIVRFDDQQTDFGPLTRFPSLTHIELTGLRGENDEPMPSENVDLGFLADMPNLQSVKLAALGGIDLGPLEAVARLRALQLWNVRSDRFPTLLQPEFSSLRLGIVDIEDLSPVSQAQGLRELDLIHTDFESLSFVRPLTDLTWVAVSGARPLNLSDLAVLASLENLELLVLAARDPIVLGNRAEIDGFFARDE